MSAATRATPSPADRPGIRVMPLLNPSRRLLPGVPRSMVAVDPVLRELFRELTAGRAPWPLFLFGNVGGGKTSAALALCDVVATAAYFTADGLCCAILEQDPSSVRDLWQTIEAKSLIVLDEIGARSNTTDFAYSTLKRAIDARDQHAGRAAVYISNLGPAELARLYDERLASRILCGTRFELSGTDRRFE
jgi:DNA replication protein DnaC